MSTDGALTVYVPDTRWGWPTCWWTARKKVAEWGVIATVLARLQG